MLQHCPLLPHRVSKDLRGGLRVLLGGYGGEGGLGQPLDPLNEALVQLLEADQGTGEHFFVELVLGVGVVGDEQLELVVEGQRS